MKKFITASLCIIGLSFSATTASAQNNDKATVEAFGEGSENIGIALGFGRSHGYYGSYVSLPALTVMYDRGWMDAGPGTISIGGVAGFKTAYYDYPGGTYKANWSSYILAARGAYHLHLKNPSFDPYAGLMLGFRFNSYDDTYYDKFGANPYNYASLDAVAGLFIGAKYNFTSKTGVFLELGYDISVARLGLSFKL